MNQSQRDSYGTPPEVFDYMHSRYHFTLDVAASHNNHLLDTYLTAETDALSVDWLDHGAKVGGYAWCNPPYSDIGPWVSKASVMQLRGVGTVMLVMADQSVGWFKTALELCNEVIIITGGRLSFMDPLTGKPAAGNNKGSMFLVWHPFGQMIAAQTSYIERDYMIRHTKEIIYPARQKAQQRALQVDLVDAAGQLIDANDAANQEPVKQSDQCEINALPSESAENSAEDDNQSRNPTADDPNTRLFADKTLDDWHWEYQNGDNMALPNGQWPRFVVVITILFGIRERYSSRNVATAIAVCDDQLMDEFTSLSDDKKTMIRMCLRILLKHSDLLSIAALQEATMAMTSTPDFTKLPGYIQRNIAADAIASLNSEVAA